MHANNPPLTAMFCPHCNGELQNHDDVRGARCPSCRLVVGASRALAVPSGEALSSGFAANAARREEAEPVEEEFAFTALRAVADQVGVNVERMRMVDFDRASREDKELPSVAEILSTFDTWKRARSLARLPAAAQAEELARTAAG